MKTALIACLFFCLVVFAGTASAEYKFKVHNTTSDKIVELFASEDGKSWGNFDIGSGIAAGEKAELAWDKSTDESNCEWHFKAKFADGEESDAVEFDFCEEDLELEF